MITLLDGYLVNHFDDFVACEQKVKQGKLGRVFADQWKETKKNLEKLSGSLKEIPNLGIWSKAQTISRGLSFALTAIGLIVLFSQPFFISPLFYLGLVVFYAGLTLLVISWYSGWRLAKDLQRYFDSHSQKYGFARAYVRERVQELVLALRRHMRDQGLPQSGIRLELFNVDYRGIVAGKKSRLSRKYTAFLDLDAD